MNQRTAHNILNQTREDYNRIATDFAIKRTRITADVQELCKYANSGDNVLDLGCGSGRLSEVLSESNINYIGADNSSSFINWARSNYPDKQFILLTEETRLPFPDNSFDKIFCLAVIHHLPSQKIRQAFFQEIKRTLKPKGQLILTTWNVWHNPGMSKKVWQNNLKKIFGLSQLDWNDLIWQYQDTTNNVTINRYLHAFREKELIRLAKQTGLCNVKVKLNYRGKKVINSNYLLEAKKPA